MKKTILILSVSAIVLSACGTQAPQKASVQTYGVQKGAGSTGTHTVLPGDTVYKIAENYQLPMREIITLNGIEAPYNLTTGFRVKLPPPNEHEVKPGDTVKMLANMYDVSPNRLAELNNLRPPFKLTAGQRLRLPTPTPAPTPVMTQNAVMNAPQDFAAQTSSGYSLETAPSASVQAVEAVPIDNMNVAAVNTGNNALSGYPPQPVAKPAAVQDASLSSSTIPEAPVVDSGKRFMRPVEGRIVSSYGTKADGLHNDGINIKAPKGAPVRAAEKGTVVYTGDDLEGYGNLVLVRHDGGMISAYAHLDKMLVKRGDKVSRGQSIATVGSTGGVDSPQLHFEIRQGTKPMDPAPFI